ALGGEVYFVAATIGGAPAPFDPSPAFEAVQDGDDPARPHSEHLAGRLLADTGVVADQPQQSGLRCGDVQRGKGLLKSCGGVGPQLGEQEGDAAWSTSVHGNQVNSLDESFMGCIIFCMNQRSS